jgi:hypothetical protein
MPRLAVLIDAENIEVEHCTAVVTAAQAVGDLNVIRLYGDFTEQRLSGWLEMARARGYQISLQLNGGKGKNSTDISLTIDAMDILNGGCIDAFVLVSDDRDFVPLARRLRSAGKRVYAICKTADERLSAICSDVVELTAKRTITALAEWEASADEIAFTRDLLAELCEANIQRSVSPAVFGAELKRRRPDISKRIGGPKLVKRLVKAAIANVHGDGTLRIISPERA